MLGVSSQCVWRDSRTLVAYLSPDYTLRPGSMLAFRPFTLRGALENNEYTSGSIKVTGPSHPSPVTAVLTGPTVLGPCDGLFLSALGTRGAGSAQLKYTWMVMAPESAESRLTHVKNLLASHDGATLELPPGTLPAGHTFVFSLRVTSIWGSRDTATLTVETEAQPSRPSVTLHGPAVEYLDATEPLLLEADVSLPSGGCPAAPTAAAGATSFRWSVIPEIYFHPSMQEALENPKLVVPPGLMQPGQSYTWTLAARDSQGQQATTSVSKVVNAVVPPIEVEGALGPDRTASIRSNLRLEASPVDPLDSLSEQSAPWTFKWSCLRRCWGARVPCDPAVEGEPCGEMGLGHQRGQSVTVLAGAMEDGYRYFFQALIAREPLFDGSGNVYECRVRVAGVIIDAVDAQNNPVLPVSISGEPSGGAINANQPLVLDCKGAPSGGTIVWELERGDLPNGYSLKDVALSNGGLSPAGQRQLVVPSDSFTPGQEIELSCTVVSADGRASGKASAPLFVRPAPHGGTLAMRVRSSSQQASSSWEPLDAAKGMEMAQAGTSLVDSNGDGIGDIFVGGFEELGSIFHVAAAGWTYPGKEILGGEVQPSLRYQFFYRVGDGLRVPFTGIQASGTAETLLPAGVITLEVDITGPGGVAITYQHPLAILVSEPGGLSAQSDMLHPDLPALSGPQRELYSRFLGEQKLENVAQFVNIWTARSCIRQSRQEVDDTAQCGGRDDVQSVTKATMAANLASLDRGRSLTSGYVELMSCSVASLACDPSEISPAAQQEMFTVASSLLQSILTQQSVALKDSKPHFQALLDSLWLAAEADCVKADSTVAENNLQLAEMTNRFALALSLDNVPGAVQLVSAGRVLDVSTARVIGDVAQILSSDKGVRFRGRVAGLPPSTEMCLAMWTYTTSSSPDSQDYISPLPEVDTRLSQASLVFGFAASENCSHLSEDGGLSTATVTLSTDTQLSSPEASLLGCWSTSSGWSFSESSLSGTGSPSAEELSASLPLPAGTEMCSWFQPSEGFSPDVLDNVPVYAADNGTASSSGMPGWVIVALSTVVGVMVVLVAGVAVVVAIRRRQADADATAVQLRAAATAKAPWETNPLSTDPQQPRPAIGGTQN